MSRATRGFPKGNSKWETGNNGSPRKSSPRNGSQSNNSSRKSSPHRYEPKPKNRPGTPLGGLDRL